MVACRTTLLQRHKVRQPHIFGKSKFQFLGRPAPSTAAGGPRRQGPWRLRCCATLLRQMKNVRPIFAASSSVRTEPSVRHVQTDHDSAYNDQNNRDQCQLKPAKRCCPFKHRAPVDFTTKPSPCNRVRDEADPDCSGNKVTELEQKGCNICDFSDDVFELEDRILNVSLQLEKG